MLNSNSYNIDVPFSAYRQAVVCIYVTRVLCTGRPQRYFVFGSRPPQQCECQNKASYMNFFSVQIKLMFILYCILMKYNSII